MKHELGVNLGIFCSDKPDTPFSLLKETALICRDNGFSHFDYQTCLQRDDFEDHAKQFRAFLDENGMSVHQSHAPFNHYGAYPADIFPMLQDRCLTVASILGAKHLVVHADEYFPGPDETFDGMKVVGMMYERFAPLVERARTLGVGIAFENLFEDGYKGVKRSRCCSTLEELLGLIERFADPTVTCCWDFGHARCSFGFDGCADALRQAGKYVTCTHVHDNRHGDDHLIPFTGFMNWGEQMKALKEIGYDGYFTYEFVYLRYPQSLIGDYLKLARKTGEYLLSL